jgi:nucleotidyltransferase substrate binding protein (TIGR01987 family)
MERLLLKYKDAEKALKTLEEISRESFSIIVRDASIQRFEYTFEALWKFIREYLKEKEGIIANSPKSCFREIFTLGILAEDETEKCLKMTDRRNDTSHTYKEEVAEIIYSELNDYVNLIKTVMERFHNNLNL